MEIAAIVLDSILARCSFHFNPITKVVSSLPTYLNFLGETVAGGQSDSPEAPHVPAPGDQGGDSGVGGEHLLVHRQYVAVPHSDPGHGPGTVIYNIIYLYIVIYDIY